MFEPVNIRMHAFGRRSTDAPRRLDAVDERHADVHQRHVRGERRCKVDGLEAILRRADDGNPLVGREQGLHHLDEQRLVIHDEDAHGIVVGLGGGVDRYSPRK